LLFAFIGSIACCGLAGIYCLLVGGIGWLEERVLLTTTAVGTASILGLASAIPWERRRWHPIGAVGMIVVAVTLGLVLVPIWYRGAEHEWYFKMMSAAMVASVAVPLVGLVGLARLRAQYEWVRLGTVAAISVLAGQACVSIVFDVYGSEWFRLMGALAIVTVCGTIAVPILHRVSAIRVRESIQTTELQITLTCPRCQRTQTLPVGQSKCGYCGLGLSIMIEEAHCRVCGYPLHGLMSATCPECGTPLAAQEAVASRSNE
jgi:hypothetical protein